MIQFVVTIIVLTLIILLLYGVLNGQKSSKAETSSKFIDKTETEYFLLNLLRTRITIDDASLNVAEFIPLAVEDGGLFRKLKAEVKKLIDRSGTYLKGVLKYGEEEFTLIDQNTGSRDIASTSSFIFHLPSLKGEIIELHISKYETSEPISMVG